MTNRASFWKLKLREENNEPKRTDQETRIKEERNEMEKFTVTTINERITKMLWVHQKWHYSIIM